MQQYNSSEIVLRKLDRKAARVRQSMMEASQEQITGLWKQLDLSLIFHDSALEGQVISPEELNSAFDTRSITDVSSLTIFETLRSHRRALDLAREVASRRKLVFTLELFQDFNELFAADPEDAKAGRYRREVPLHRTYFHEICEPAKISTNMRQLVDWLNDPDEADGVHPLRWAAKFHYRFMRTFPFLDTSGKVGRAVMNATLIRQGFLPAIIHATERQRYYEAIRQSPEELVTLLSDSEMSSLDAAEKFLRRKALAS